MLFVQPHRLSPMAITAITATVALWAGSVPGSTVTPEIIEAPGKSAAKPAPARAPRFEVTELPVPDDANSAQAVAINDRGQVVVEYFGPKSSGCFVWEKGKPPRPLGQMKGSFRLQPLAINEAGQVVGIAWGENDLNYRKRRAFFIGKRHSPRPGNAGRGNLRSVRHQQPWRSVCHLVCLR